MKKNLFFILFVAVSVVFGATASFGADDVHNEGEDHIS